MRDPDTVQGILSPYVNQFSLWGSSGLEYQTGDAVPDVGMANTYAVRLPAPKGSKRVWLWVQSGKITNVMALQPITGKGVFDHRGRYLGCGGETLDEPSSEEPVLDLLTAVKNRNTKSEVRPPTEVVKDGGLESQMLLHTFHLRSSLQIQILLPNDLTKGEASRLARFLTSLPF